MKNFRAFKTIEEGLTELNKRVKIAHSIPLEHQQLTLMPYLGTAEIVSYQTNELIALCPLTLYPDFYSLEINYIPNKKLPELKSLKFYLMDYKNLAIGHEHLADRIYRDFKAQVKPLGMHLILKSSVRGGITTTVEKGGIS